ncbi:MAG: hypothetical protein QOJ86_4379 [Bradyrhizobium sp.]|jgi:hypothetical protein|nr:hypothetical protein [Bradyrhizobium sp.]
MRAAMGAIWLYVFFFFVARGLDALAKKLVGVA